jgi:hypothetical protein
MDFRRCMRLSTSNYGLSLANKSAGNDFGSDPRFALGHVW